MARTKRGKPYNPALAEYQRQQEAEAAAKKRSRMATEFNKGVAKFIAPMDVEDPDDRDGGIITVARQTRNDPLAGLHSRKLIDEAQYHGGRQFQRDFETAERGPRAIDPSKEAVDGGRIPEPITEPQRRAAKRLGQIHRGLGLHGSALMHAFLITGLSAEKICEDRRLTAERERLYVGRRIRECLEELAVFYGLAAARCG